MALRRYTRPVDGTIPVYALLYNDEELLASQDNVGVYDGTQKSPDHQNGTVHVTTHRLFFLNGYRASIKSFEMDLSFIVQTEYYAGLFSSSPKVTCHLSGARPAGLGSSLEHRTEVAHAQFDSWECEVCAYRNPPGLSPAAARICALCGVPRTAVPNPNPSVSTTSSKHHLSTSLPTSALSLSPSLHTGNQTRDINYSTSSSSNNEQDSSSSSIACPACTFLNYPSLRSCEICGTELARPPPRVQLRSAPSSRAITPDEDDEDDESPKMIKISFRKGGDKPFYAVLKRSLRAKAWEGNGTGKQSTQDTYSTDSDNRNAVGRSGITGILRTVETSAKGRETHMKDALQDLEALMVKAKDMVKLAAELNEKLTAASITTTPAVPPKSESGSASFSSGVTTLVSDEPEEATFIRSSLSQLGLQMANTPVTLDMIKDERRWIEELARELARVLQGPPGSSTKDQYHYQASFDNDRLNLDGVITAGMMKDRGIIALDEVWGGWNRARGVALIPPSTLLQVVPHLPAYTNPTIRHRAFASGLNVLHTPPYTTAAFSSRLSSFLVMNGPQTTFEVSLHENLTVALTAEMIDAAELDGGVCRDDNVSAIVGGGPGGGTGVELKWWPNIFHGYIWDGQE